MNFKELLSQLEEHLGSHQFPVNPAATIAIRSSCS